MKIKITILCIIIAIGLANYGLQIVEYYDFYVSLHYLRSQGIEFHCVQKSIIGKSTQIIDVIFPYFKCFNTIGEVRNWLSDIR